MRTTLTLDADLARALKDLADRTGARWRDVVNDTIRRGLKATPPPQEPYTMETTDTGPPVLQGVHSVHDMLVHSEGEAFR